MATGEGREAVAAAIFWMKARAGWREKSEVELTGKDGRDFSPTVIILPSNGRESS